MTSRFFHALVVVGAGISAAACGGKSEGTSGEDGASNGTGGGGGTAASGAGTTQGGSGGSAAGGSTGGSMGGTGGSAGGTGGSGSVLGGMGGTQPTGPFPDPGPTAQWDCRGVVPSEAGGPSVPLSDGCVDVLGVTAAHLVDDCPVNPMLAKSAAECTSAEIFTCRLAVTVDGASVLINCDCEMRYEDGCGYCTSLDQRYGDPVSCTPELKICECAYTGILR